MLLRVSDPLLGTVEQVNQAKAREIDGVTLITILAIMNYKGPHSQ